MCRMRRYLLLPLCAVLFFALAACGGDDDDDAGGTPTAGPGTDPAAVPSATPFGGDAVRYQVTGDGQSNTGSPLTGANVSSGPSNNPSNTSAGEYVVQAGDSFFSIAGQFGITVEELLDLNNMTPDTIIQPDDVLRVPGQGSSSSGTATPTGTPGTSATPAAGEESEDPDDGDGNAYVVADGASCASIAATFGISAGDLIAANGLPSECNTLQIGQELTIP